MAFNNFLNKVKEIDNIDKLMSLGISRKIQEELQEIGVEIKCDKHNEINKLLGMIQNINISEGGIIYYFDKVKDLFQLKIEHNQGYFYDASKLNIIEDLSLRELRYRKGNINIKDNISEILKNEIANHNFYLEENISIFQIESYNYILRELGYIEKIDEILEEDYNKSFYSLYSINNEKIMWILFDYIFRAISSENKHRYNHSLKYRNMEFIKRAFDIQECKSIDLMELIVFLNRNIYCVLSIRDVNKDLGNNIDYRCVEKRIGIARSYLYQIKLKTDIVFGLYKIQAKDNLEMRRYNNKKDYTIDFPKKIYIQELLEYFNVGVSAENMLLKYLSYYHVVEYFLEDMFYKSAIDTVRSNISSPMFSLKDDESIKELILEVNKGIYLNEDGKSIRFKEIDQINNTLTNYNIDKIKIKKRIEDLYPSNYQDIIEYYKSKNHSFIKNVPVFDLDKDGKKDKIGNISNRIYRVRNSLVHSKNTGGDSYSHANHSGDLRKEIPLIKSIATLLIEESGELI